MGRKPQYIVNLTASEQKKLLEISRDPDISRTVRFRVNILIEADIAVQPVLNQKQIATRAGTTPATVSNIIRKFGSEGLEAVLNLKRSPNSDRDKKKTDGRTEAIIIAKACTSPPYGRVRWTVSLLKEECEKLLDQSISRATVHRILVKNEFHPHKNIRRNVKNCLTNPSVEQQFIEYWLKMSSILIKTNIGVSHQKKMRRLSPGWKMSWKRTRSPMIQNTP